MYSDEDIASAVQAGIISEDNATAFRDHVDHLRSTPVVDEEQFRLITGFNDIFVVIASMLLLVSVSWIGTVLVDNWFGFMLEALPAWLLAEYFTRKRSMALPSIVLLLTFVGGIFISGFLFFDKYDFSDGTAVAIPGIMAAIAAWVHWRRFKVPITIAAGIATLVACATGILIALVPEAKQWLGIIMIIPGVIVFLIAMRWDSSDILRQTRRSDVAFWLHLVAAPLLVHPIFSLLNVFESEISLWQAGVVATLYILIALISISVDRRALMVSALIYVLYVFSVLLKQFGLISLNFALTAFFIGFGLLMLSAFWHSFRKSVVSFYPDFIKERLPPVE